MNNPKPQHIIYFDGVCNLCHWSVIFILRRDKNQKFSFAPLQSKYAKDHLTQIPENIGNFDTVIYQNDQKVYIKSRAAVELLIELGGFWKIAGIFKLIPKGLVDIVYDFIAKNRYRWFGRKSECLVPTADIKSRFLE